MSKKVRVEPGASWDMLDKDDVSSAIRDQASQWQYQKTLGIKHMRLPVLNGTAASNALTLGSSQQVGPRSGYCWSIRRLVVNGLTSGSSADVMNIYFNSTTSPPVWQVTGNDFTVKFGQLELTMYGGDTLLAANVGNLSSGTGLITVSGEVVEVPQEKLAELA